MKCEKGNELYRKAKKLIPGGTQLLSKRPEMFLPEQWPSYYTRAKGVEIWDIDDNRYIDVGSTGIGTCILGYADPDVDAAVKKAVDAGNLTTLNCPEEIELVELLCDIHKWAEMGRFTRSGGESLVVAIRIARAATGKDKIAFCGYHGWHDWYLSANLASGSNLDAQLLPGLEPAGVPRGLSQTILPFNYNKPEELQAIIDQHGSELATIVMEPVRNVEPQPGFLEKVRELADKSKAVLIFDEVTSGWRMTLGGCHLLYGVKPDMAVFAKGLSNGYPMGAVIGKRSIMDCAQKSFISSTYWTDKIGPTAALATIRKMQKNNVAKHIGVIADQVRTGWAKIAKSHDLPVKIMGMPQLSVLSYDIHDGDQVQALATLYVQEMLDRGYLAAKTFYPTYSHNEKIAQDYLKTCDEVFALMAKAHKENSVLKMLRGPVAMSGFKRLN